MGSKKQKETSQKRTEAERKGSTESTPQKDHSAVGGDKLEVEEISKSDFINESTGDEEATDAIGFFHALFLSVLNFVKPWYEYIKGYNPILESVLNFLECVEKRLEDFFRKHDITDITWDDIIEFLKSGIAEVKSYFTGANDPLAIVNKYWHKTHLAVLESLEDIERIHDKLFPPIEGVEPLFKLDKSEKYQIRQICFYMNMNLMHRVWLTMSKSVLDWMKSCSLKSKTIPKQTEKSTEDASTKKTGAKPIVEIIIEPVD